MMNLNFIIIINLVFNFQVYRGQLEGKVRDASCIKAGMDSVYTIGGQEVQSHSWSSLSKIYKTKVKLLLNSSSKETIWKPVDLPSYVPRGSHTTAASSIHSNLVYYYGGESLDYGDLMLKGFHVGVHKSLVISPRPEEIAMMSKSKGNSSLFKTSFSLLLINDLNSDEVILVGGGVVDGDGRSLIAKGIHIYNPKLDTWESFYHGVVTDGIFYSAILQGSVYLFGPGIKVDSIPDGYRIPENEKGTKLVLAKFDIKEKKMGVTLSDGKIPNFNSNFDYLYTQGWSSLYLISKHESIGSDLYTLDLKSDATSIWNKIELSEFTTFQDGCLTYHQSKLIHYFGTDNDHGIQSIDLDNYHSVSIPKKDIQSYFTRPENNILLYILIGSFGGLLLLTLSVILTIILINRYRKFPPPKFHHDLILCEPPSIRPHPKTNLIEGGGGAREREEIVNSELFKLEELKQEESFSNELQPSHPMFNPLLHHPHHQRHHR